MGKVITTLLKNEIVKAAGLLQCSAGCEAGYEAAVCAIRQCFYANTSDAVLLTDAKNAFNCLNRKVNLENIKILCPLSACFLIKHMQCPTKALLHLHTHDASKILSEVKNQGTH